MVADMTKVQSEITQLSSAGPDGIDKIIYSEKKVYLHSGKFSLRRKTKIEVKTSFVSLPVD